MKFTAFVHGGRLPGGSLASRGFAGRPGGLLELKVEQLLAVSAIERIVVSARDTSAGEILRSFDDPRLRLHRADDDVPSSKAPDAAWIPLVQKLVPSGHVLWTRAAMPFFGADLYTEAVETYAAALEVGRDSLMAVTPLTRGVWMRHGPSAVELTESPSRPGVPAAPAEAYQVTGGLYLQSLEQLRRQARWVGRTPWMFETSTVAAFEVNTAVDLDLARAMLAAGHSVF